MRKFTQYLRKVGRLEIPEVYLRDESTDSKIVWLNLEEVKQLYAASDKVIYRYNHYRDHRSTKGKRQSHDGGLLWLWIKENGRGTLGCWSVILIMRSSM